MPPQSAPADLIPTIIGYIRVSMARELRPQGRSADAALPTAVLGPVGVLRRPRVAVRTGRSRTVTVACAALAAHGTATFPVAGVRLVVSMTVRAMRDSSLVTPDVLGMRHRFEVFGVAAGPVVALMIEFGSLRDGADLDLIHRAVGELLRIAGNRHDAIAIPVDAQLPFPASAGGVLVDKIMQPIPQRTCRSSS